MDTIKTYMGLPIRGYSQISYDTGPFSNMGRCVNGGVTICKCKHVGKSKDIKRCGSCRCQGTATHT